MFWYLSGLVLLSLIHNYQSKEVSATVSCNDVEGYYWRDYTGEIPSDALAGGKNADGETTYIGQVWHNGLLTPGKIDSTQKKMFYEWGRRELSTDQQVKILCTSHPEKFEWVSATSDNFKNLQDHKYILSGVEPSENMYIGRTYHEGELALGKLQVRKSDLLAILHTTTKDHSGTEHYQFEVLSYNPNNTVVSTRTRGGSNAGCKQVSVNFFID